MIIFNISFGTKIEFIHHFVRENVKLLENSKLFLKLPFMCCECRPIAVFFGSLTQRNSINITKTQNLLSLVNV